MFSAQYLLSVAGTSLRYSEGKPPTTDYGQRPGNTLISWYSANIL